jgi:hypothetical protein
MADLPRSSPGRARLASRSEGEERAWRAVEGASVEWKLQLHGRAAGGLYRAWAGRGGRGCSAGSNWHLNSKSTPRPNW